MAARSARGLFRAMGKASKPVPVRDLLTGEIVKVDALEREEEDFYPTPPEPTQAFLAAELPVLRRFGAIWEPAAGDGAMARDMRAVGLPVFCSDLIDRGCGALVQDFYDFRAPPVQTSDGRVALVTNPPYDECNWRDGGARWISHALDVLNVDYMALLLNWSWPGAGGLGPLWDRIPPARVYLMRWKIDFTGQGSPPNLNAWFVWERGFQGNPPLLMLDRVDARQGVLFGNDGRRLDAR